MNLRHLSIEEEPGGAKERGAFKVQRSRVQGINSSIVTLNVELSVTERLTHA